MSGDKQIFAAQAEGLERYEGFVEALGRKLAKGGTLANEVSETRILKGATHDDPTSQQPPVSMVFYMS